jgi:hypothetical protein
VIVDYFKVWDLTEYVALHTGYSDRLIWWWSSDGAYSATSAYRALFLGSCVVHGAKETWEAQVTSKVHHFFWLVLHRRC